MEWPSGFLTLLYPITTMQRLLFKLSMRNRHALHAKWLFIHSILSSFSNLLAMEHSFHLFVGWLQHNWVTGFFLRRSTQQSYSKSRWWKSMLIHQEWFTALFSQQLLDSQSLESPICILQALNMPLIRCTNVFFQGWLSRHITFPSEKTRPESWPGNTWVRQLRSGSCHYPTAANKCNEQPSQATANPAGGKACSSTKGGLLRYIVNTYSIHKVCILQALNMCYNQMRQEND